MICLSCELQSAPSADVWDLVSGLLHQFHSQGVDEGEEPAPEGEKALLAGDEFLQAIQPGKLSTPQAFKAYFENRNDAERAERAIEPVLQSCKPIFKIEDVEIKDYSAEWRASFKPLHVAGHWLIRAPWHPSTAAPVAASTAAPVATAKAPLLHELVIEPGMAFGTGSHETTQSCLQLLAEKLSQPKQAAKLSILDFGCGSGVLAIACKRLGVKQVLGVDIDPLAIDATHRNAALNNLSIDATLTMPAKPSYDGIVANILKNTLLEFAPKFKAWLKPGGFLILSGLLTEQFQNIKTAYEALGFKIEKKIEAGEWVSLLLQRP